MMSPLETSWKHTESPVEQHPSWANRPPSKRQEAVPGGGRGPLTGSPPRTAAAAAAAGGAPGRKRGCCGSGPELAAPPPPPPLPPSRAEAACASVRSASSLRKRRLGSGLELEGASDAQAGEDATSEGGDAGPKAAPEGGPARPASPRRGTGQGAPSPLWRVPGAAGAAARATGRAEGRGEAAPPVLPACPWGRRPGRPGPLSAALCLRRLHRRRGAPGRGEGRGEARRAPARAPSRARPLLPPRGPERSARSARGGGGSSLAPPRPTHPQRSRAEPSGAERLPSPAQPSGTGRGLWPATASGRAARPALRGEATRADGPGRAPGPALRVDVAGARAGARPECRCGRIGWEPGALGLLGPPVEEGSGPNLSPPPPAAAVPGFSPRLCPRNALALDDAIGQKGVLGSTFQGPCAGKPTNSSIPFPTRSQAECR
ncbi:collagen alpha-1(I) chain-like [Eublepharis macularius]|uniref:Collagen alpha-1(I) chain-like n=1 Tax=Eublepharis macularius TaxID=481883 RepID=A0AA97KJ95_EUBMA|nr:collagen alpha-1(I) chain-like [Eublepharis macularius]